MIRALLIAALAWVPVSAQALSCMPHSVQAAYLQADAAEARFVIVRGLLDFDRSALPKVDWDNQQATPPVTEITATLHGKSLSGGAFQLPFEKDVILQVDCIGPWCASVPEGAEVLAFVELRDGAADRIATNPCGGYLFATPTPLMIRAIEKCAAGAECTPLK